jgi:hypothetical protein
VKENDMSHVNHTHNIIQPGWKFIALILQSDRFAEKAKIL